MNINIGYAVILHFHDFHLGGQTKVAKTKTCYKYKLLLSWAYTSPQLSVHFSSVERTLLLSWAYTAPRHTPHSLFLQYKANMYLGNQFDWLAGEWSSLLSGNRCLACTKLVGGAEPGLSWCWRVERMEKRSPLRPSDPLSLYLYRPELMRREGLASDLTSSSRCYTHGTRRW